MNSDIHHCRCFKICINDIEKCKYELQKLGFKKQPVGEEDHGQVFGLRFKFNDLLQIHWKVMSDGLIESEMEPPPEIPGAHVNTIHSFSSHNTVEPILQSLKLPYETLSSVPETTKLFQKKTNQDKGNWLELIREDRRYNIWIDENGLLWEKNNYDSFKQITFADYTKADDSTKNVINRLHSAFNGLIQSEAERAISVWNSTSIQSQIGESFTHEIPTSYSNKLDDPKVINSLQYQEELAM